MSNFQRKYITVKFQTNIIAPYLRSHLIEIFRFLSSSFIFESMKMMNDITKNIIINRKLSL